VADAGGVGVVDVQAGGNGREDRDGAGGPRAIRRRRGLPGSRAVAGGLLVAAAAVGLFSASSRAGEAARQHYVVAGRSLAPGARIEASDLAVQRLHLPPPVAARAFADRQLLVGATVLAPLAPGELVQASSVVAGRGVPATRELSFTIEPGRVSGGLRRGERVDLLATYGSGSDGFTAVIVRQALLVSLEAPAGSLGGGSPAMVTVALDDTADVLALAHAVQVGKVTVVRATGAAGSSSPPATYRPPRPAGAA
jgi:Flp pilus assembly protein CpaB